MPATGADASIPPPRVILVRSLLQAGSLPFTLVLLSGAAGLAGVVSHPRIQKSGLAIVGQFEGVSAERVQILGQTEISFLETLEAVARRKACMGFFTPGFSCAIVTSASEPPP